MGNCIGNATATKMNAKNPASIDLSNSYLGERIMLKPSYCAKSNIHNSTETLPFVICFDQTKKEKYIRSYCELCLCLNADSGKHQFRSIRV